MSPEKPTKKGLAFGKPERWRGSRQLGEEKEGDDDHGHRSESRGAGKEHHHDSLEWIAELLRKVDVLHKSVGKNVKQCTVEGETSEVLKSRMLAI